MNNRKYTTVVSHKMQAEIEKNYENNAFKNLLCLVTTVLNMYISDGVVTDEFIEKGLPVLLDKYVNHEKGEEYGKLIDLNKFSNDMAKALGLSRYYEYAYDTNGDYLTFKTEEEFYNSGMPYGIGNFSNDLTPEHYMLYSAKTKTRINPGGSDNYKLNYIRAVFSQQIDTF